MSNLTGLIYTIDSYKENEQEKSRIWITGTTEAFTSSSFSTADIKFDKVYIETNAFADCKNLTGLELAENTVLVNTNAFKNCTNLIDITILSENIRIDCGAFTGCTNVSKISGLSFSTTLPTVGHLFGGRSYMDNKNIVPSKLTELVIDNLTSYCCYNCISLSTVYFNDYPTCIPKGAFANCKNLKIFADCEESAKIGVLNISGMTKIEKDAFYGCLAINTIYYKSNSEVPEVIIQTDAFKNCKNLYRIFTDYNKFKIGSTKHGYIAMYAQFIASEETTFEPITGGYFVYDNVYYYTNIDDLVTNKILNLKLPDESKSGNVSPKMYLIGTCGIKNEKVEEIIISSDVKFIGANCFTGCINLKSIVFDTDAEQIAFGANVFNDCVNLTTLKIPSLNSWLTHTFHYPQVLWTNIDNLIIGESLCIDGKLTLKVDNNAVNIIPECAFMHAKVIKEFNVVSSSSDTTLGEIDKVLAYAFYDCSNLSAITGFDTLSYLHETAFVGCNYTIGASLKTLGGIVFGPINTDTEFCIINPAVHKQFTRDAFKACLNLKNIYFMGSLADWCQLDFANVFANPLYQADISNAEVNIPNRQLYLNCSYQKDSESELDIIGTKWDFKLTGTDIITEETAKKLKTEKIANKLTIVKKFTFSGIRLTSLDVGYKYASTDIDYTLVNKTTLGANFTSIFEKSLINSLICDTEFIGQIGGNSATNCVNYNQIADIYIKVADNNAIPSAAFKDCITLKTIKLDQDIQVIGDYAFTGCVNLETCIYTGALVGNLSWSTIKFNNESANPLHLTNTTNKNIKLIIQKASPTQDISQITYISGFNTSKLLPYTFLNFKKLRHFIFDAANLIDFDINAFTNCSALRELSCGQYNSSHSYHAITKYNNGEAIGAYIVRNADNCVMFATAGDYSIDDYATCFDKDAFKYSKSITGLIIGKQIKSIPLGLLAGCRNLSQLTLPYLGPQDDCDIFGRISINQQETFVQLCSIGYIFGLPPIVNISENDTNKTFIQIEPHINLSNQHLAKTFALTLSGDNIQLPDNCLSQCSFITKLYISGDVDCDRLSDNWLDLDASGRRVAESSYISSGLCKGITRSATNNDIVFLVSVATPKEVTNVTSLRLADSIKYIYKKAFSAWSNNTICQLSLVFPDTLKYIGKSALCNCTFTNIELPYIYLIAADAFKNSLCTKLSLGALLATIDIESENYKQLAQLRAIKEAVLPVSLCKILQKNIINKQTLEKVTFNSSGAIDNEAFANFINLSEIALTNNTTISGIGDAAFYNCTNLQKFPWDEISYSCTNIGTEAFYNCTEMLIVRLPYALNPLVPEADCCWASTNTKSYYFTVPVTGTYRIISDELVATCINLDNETEEAIDFNTITKLEAGTKIKFDIRLKIPDTPNVEIRHLATSSFYLVLETGVDEDVNSSNIVLDLPVSTNRDGDIQETWQVTSLTTAILPKRISIKLNFYVTSGYNNKLVLLRPKVYEVANLPIKATAFKRCINLLEVLNDADYPISRGDPAFGEVATNAISIISTRNLNAPSTNFHYYNDFMYIFDTESYKNILVKYDNYEELDSIYLYALIDTIRTGTFTSKHKFKEIIAEQKVDLEYRAFENCSELMTITLKKPGTVSKDSIVGCPKLDTVSFGNPAQLVLLSNPFNNCPELQTINLTSNSIYKIVSYVLQQDNKDYYFQGLVKESKLLVLLYCKNTVLTDTKELFHEIISIGDYACRDLPVTIQELNICESIVYIGEGTFDGTHINSLNLKANQSLAEIGNFAFADCGIQTITGTNISTVEDITDYTTAEQPLSIGICAFSNNKLLGNLYLNNITMINNFAFELNNLSSINVKKSEDSQTFGQYWAAKVPTPRVSPTAGYEDDYYSCYDI